jgi:tetratricopeptide (TPR) repeat protein
MPINTPKRPPTGAPGWTPPAGAPATSPFGQPTQSPTRPQAGKGRGPKGQSTREQLLVLQRGIEFHRQRRFPEAERCYQTVLRDDPGNPDALNLLGTLAVEAGAFEQSIDMLERAVKAQPKNPVFRNNLANSYLLALQPQKALPHLRKAISLSPDLIEPLMNMARGCRAAGKADKAIEYYRKVLTKQSDHAAARHGLAEALVDLGRMDEAIAELRDCLALGIRSVPAAVTLSAAKKFTSDDKEDVARIAALLDKDNLDPQQGIALKHALGKINNDLKRYADAFGYFAEAKDAAGADFDIDEYRKEIDRKIAFFTPDVFAQKRGVGDPSERPVFIVGMPRSGTTLTEQILSSHPQVKGAGELTDMERLVRRMSPAISGEDARYNTLKTLTPEAARPLAQSYLTVLKRHSATALRVIDKMPHNFQLLGVIALLFPNARVIYCRRDPMDNCVSCFMNHFAEAHGYNTNLEKLGLYYREHVRLMDHWKAVLPIRIFESRYEDLIADQEGRSRELVEFLGLEWDDVCLSYYEQDRTVSTPSRWQVRQPIYTSSMKRWKRYDIHLGPLKQALGDLFVEDEEDSARPEA